MEMQDVKSSNIAKVGYDASTRDMHVHFMSGWRYVLHEVEPEIFEQFLRAKSLGKFYADNIRGVYEFDKLEVE